MDSIQKTREFLRYSTFDQADKHLNSCSLLAKLTLVLPIPLIAGAVAGFFYFQPHWYRDPFMWAILMLFVIGQVGALGQLIGLIFGTRKAKKTLMMLRKGGDRPELESLQEALVVKAPSCHIRDNVLRWIQLGIQGETHGIERMMEHSAVRREQAAGKIMSFHTVINRITLKLGFVGTLIGLMMTFEPMKQAMLSLQNSTGEFKFITDICKAVDGDAYAIATTLFATGLSIFLELLTIQMFDRILGQFEMVNNNLDDWCIIHLQPWIRESYAGEKKNNDGLIEFQRQFAEKIAAVQKTMDEQVRTLAAYVQETNRQLASLAPVQQAIGQKIGELSDNEVQYRQFLQTKLQRLVPPNANKGGAG
jgi:biopolymer transport protein ExbB/TolQ